MLDTQTHQSTVEMLLTAYVKAVEMMLGQDWVKLAGAITSHHDASLGVRDLENRALENRPLRSSSTP